MLNGHSTKRDTTKLASIMTMLSHMSQDLGNAEMGGPTPSAVSPDVAPANYYLFQSIAHGLAHQNFHSYDEVKEWIDSWIDSKDALFCWDDIRKLPEKWKKLVSSDGQYFES